VILNKVYMLSECDLSTRTFFNWDWTRAINALLAFRVGNWLDQIRLESIR